MAQEIPIQVQTLGEALRDLRAARGLTQEELAERSSLSVRAIGDIERSTGRHPYKRTLEQLAAALDLSELERQRLFGLGRRPVAPAGGLVFEEVVDEDVPATNRRKLLDRPWWGVALAALCIGTTASVVLVALTRSPAALAPKVDVNRSQISRVVRLSDQLFRKSRACACDAGLDRAKISPDLSAYRQLITSLRQSGERIHTSFHHFNVQSVRMESGHSAIALARIDETTEMHRSGSLVQICAKPYRLRYHVILTSLGWRVDDTKMLGSQGCRAI